MMDFEPYLDDSDPPKIPLPEGWPDFAMAAVLHVIAVARLAIMSVEAGQAVESAMNFGFVQKLIGCGVRWSYSSRSLPSRIPGSRQLIRDVDRDIYPGNGWRFWF